VLHDGIIRAELSGTTLTKANLVAASLGASDEGAAAAPGTRPAESVPSQRVQ